MRYFVFLVFGLVLLSSCEECYVCQAYYTMDNRMIDFEKECGDADAQAAMESKFRETYPEEEDYWVRCR